MGRSHSMSGTVAMVVSGTVDCSGTVGTVLVVYAWTSAFGTMVSAGSVPDVSTMVRTIVVAMVATVDSRAISFRTVIPTGPVPNVRFSGFVVRSVPDVSAMVRTVVVAMVAAIYVRTRASVVGTALSGATL